MLDLRIIGKISNSLWFGIRKIKNWRALYKYGGIHLAANPRTGLRIGITVGINTKATSTQWLQNNCRAEEITIELRSAFITFVQKLNLSFHFLKSLLNGFFGKRLHYFVARKIGMHSIR